MRNTGIEYSSAEQTPVVLPEMAELLPPLTGEQLAALETDLLKNGCYTPIIVNEDMVIIDGHNRQSLCEKHGTPYKMAVFSFEDMLEAKQWAVDNQKGRRNLDKWELGKIALKLKPEIEAKAKANQGTRTDLSATLPEGPVSVDTRKELADAVGLGERTMGKVMQIDEHAPAAVREALDNNELSINQGYNITRQVQELPEEEREEAAIMAVELHKAKKEIRQIDEEADRRGKISGLFCKAFERALALTPTKENVRIWVECTRMRPDEIEYSVQEAQELAGVFSTIANILETLIPGGLSMDDRISVRQWQEQFQAGAFNAKDRYTQCEAGWYDWFCQDTALAGRLNKLAKVVMGITHPFILDNYYVWFKNNCPGNGPLYDDARFDLLTGERDGKYFLITLDSPHVMEKWALYTERFGFETPEFECKNARGMVKYINQIGPELESGIKPAFIAEKRAVELYSRMRGEPEGIYIFREGEHCYNYISFQDRRKRTVMAVADLNDAPPGFYAKQAEDVQGLHVYCPEDAGKPLLLPRNAAEKASKRKEAER